MQFSCSNSTPRMPRGQRLAIWASVFLVCLFWSACLIIEIEMPDTATTGEVIDVRVVIQEDVAESNTPWKGVFAVLVPEDWEFVSGEYSADDINGSVGSGMLETSDAWTDSTQMKLPAPDGMKWIGTISDEGYLHADTLIAEVNLKLQVGQTTGDFNIGYVATKESYFPSCDWFNDCDGSNTNGADTSMVNPISVTGSVAIEDVTEEGIPSQFVLEQNYPNPFNPSTTIRYALEEAAHTQLQVFDLAGREVAELVNQTQGPGVYEARFEADDLPSGMYLYRLQAGEYTETRKMVLTR